MSSLSKSKLRSTGVFGPPPLRTTSFGLSVLVRVIYTWRVLEFITGRSFTLSLWGSPEVMSLDEMQNMLLKVSKSESGFRIFDFGFTIFGVVSIFIGPYYK